MYNARLYSESNQITKKYAQDILDEYKPKIKWKNQRDRAIDIGCGDGGVTCEILRRYLPENYELLVGCDISPEMVEHASRHYSDHRTQFLQLDISGDYIPDHLVSSFDHAFSFFTFNWIQNYSKAFKNTYKLLKEGGDCVILLVGYSPVFAAHRIMAKLEKWGQYMGDVEKHLSPFHDSFEPDEEIKKVMASSGFENIEVSYKMVSSAFPSMESMTKLMTSINPFVKLIPREMIDEFIDTYMHLICTVGLHEEEIPSKPEPIYKNFVLITAYDKFGEGMGALLSTHLNQRALNNCLPGASIKQLTTLVGNYDYNDASTTIILSLGNSLSVTKPQVIKCYETLLNTLTKGVEKIIICAFPYSRLMTDKEKENAHYLNNLFCNLTFRESDFLFRN